MSKSILILILSLSFAIPSSATAQQDECEYLRDRGNRNRQSGAWARAIDTLRLFIERCANEPASASEVGSLTGAVQSFAQQMQDPSIYLTHREWLKSVMYLNTTDPLYYCAVANGILGTFAGMDDINGAIAVLDYLIESDKCSEGTPFYIKDRDDLREDQVQLWKDTVTNPDLTPLDTSKKTLEDLDLQVLRGPANVFQRSLGLNWLAIPNPFHDQVTVRFDAPHAGFVRVELFDLLGQRVSETIERQIEKGATSFTYPTENLTPGTYMLRVEFDGWQVSTQKIEKQ